MAVAAWLIAKLNVLGLPGLDQDNLAIGLASALTWLVVTGVTWAGHSKWLKGHHVEMAAQAQVSAAAITAAATPAATPAASRTDSTPAPA